jgi:hypothetical protein
VRTDLGSGLVNRFWEPHVVIATGSMNFGIFHGHVTLMCSVKRTFLGSREVVSDFLLQRFLKFWVKLFPKNLRQPNVSIVQENEEIESKFVSMI